MRHEVRIIAECAQGYEGDIGIAKLLAKGASNVNVDYIKYQLVYADELAVPSYKYYDFFKKLEMSDNDWLQLKATLSNGKTGLLFDVFGFKSLAKAKQFGADGVKITTTDFFNIELITEALSIFPLIFISIGGIHFHELDHFVGGLSSDERAKIVILNGFQAEPTPLDRNNLARFFLFRQRFHDIDFGFMDHADVSSDHHTDLSLIAVGSGVRYIEKHVTLSRVLELEDSVSAISLDEFPSYINRIQLAQEAMGREDLTLIKDELKYRYGAQKVVVAKKLIKNGDQITKDSISLKRINLTSVNQYYKQDSEILGAFADREYKVNEPLIKRKS